MARILLLIALLSPTADRPSPDKGDLNRVVGAWQTVSSRFDGEAIDRSGSRLMMTKDLMKFQPGGPGTTYGYRLDPSTDPRGIEIWPMLDSGEAGASHYGI